MNSTKEKNATAIIWTVEPRTLTDRQIDNRIKKLSYLENQIKELKKEADALKQSIIDSMTAEHVTTPKYRINYTTFTQRRIDTTAFKKELPEVAERFTKDVISHKFTYSEI